MLLVLLILSPLAARAGVAPLRLTDQSGSYDLSPHLEFLKDPSGKLSLAQVSSPPWSERFTPLGKGGIHMGLTESSFWFRLILSRPAGDQTRRYILDLGQVFLAYGHVFVSPRTGSGARTWLELEALTRTGRPADLPARFLHFPLDLAPGDKRIVYFKLRSHMALSVNPLLTTPHTFNRAQILEMVVYGALLGLLLGLACYHLVIFISLGDLSYLWYVLMVLMAIIYFAGMNGLIQETARIHAGFLDRHLPMMALALMFCFRILFAQSFLPVKEHFPRGNRLLNILLIIFLALGVLTALPATRDVGVQTFMVLGLVFPFFILAAGWSCWRGGFRPARFFFWAYLCSGLGILIYLLGMFFGLQSPFAMHHAHQLGLCAEAVLLALALGNRINTLRHEREDLRREGERRTRQHSKRLSRLVEELVRVEERERRAIAEDLHDSVTQDLTAGLWQLRNLRSGLGQEASEEMDTVCRSLDKSLADLRALTFEISPPELHDYGLPAALAALAERITDRHGLPVEYQGPESGTRLPAHLEQALFRMLRELALNAVKHAHARRAVLGLEMSDGRVIAFLSDDGGGFPPDWKRSSRSKGFGLFSIRERLRILGGKLGVASEPGKGSLVTIELGLPPAGSALKEEQT